MHSNEYWVEYYKTHKPKEPSGFAKWVVSNYADILKGKKVVDMCCGDGRDTYVLSNYCSSIKGVDPSNKPNGMGCASFLRFTAEQYILTNGSPDVLYCRFGFHAMDSDSEDLLLGWCRGRLFAEMRSDKGEVPDTTHYRRLINCQRFLEKLISRNYNVTYLSERNGFSAIASEDPCIIRIVAERK